MRFVITLDTGETRQGGPLRESTIILDIPILLDIGLEKIITLEVFLTLRTGGNSRKFSVSMISMTKLLRLW